VTELEKLKKVIELQGKAIDFYGDEDRWCTSQSGNTCIGVGWELARETQKQVEEILKGSE
jgi:hypothetical protein